MGEDTAMKRASAWCTWGGALGLLLASVSAVMLAVVLLGGFLCPDCDVDTLGERLTARARFSEVDDALWLSSFPLSLAGALFAQRPRWGRLGLVAAVLLPPLLRASLG